MVTEKLDSKIANGFTKELVTSFLSILHPAELAASSDPFFHIPGLSPTDFVSASLAVPLTGSQNCCSTGSHDFFSHPTQG